MFWKLSTEFWFVKIRWRIMFIVWKIFDTSIYWQNSYYQNLRNISFILDSLDSNYVGFINYNDKIEKQKLL